MVVHPQSAHIFYRLTVQPIEVFVGRRQSGRLREPLALKRVEPGVLRSEKTGPGRLFYIRTVD